MVTLRLFGHCRLGTALLLCAAVGAPAQGLEQLTHLGEGRTFRESSSNPDPKTNVDWKPILPGKTLVLADLKGPGTINRIWMTILPSEPAYSRLMTLRIYWDGEKNPSVECPVGDFFGVGHGLDVAMNSLPVRASADGRARSCYWNMPFRKSARVTVTNDGSLATWCFYYAVEGEYGTVAKDAPTFHASYRQEFPCQTGMYVVAEIKGRGHYVGTVVSVRSTSPGWWGEGNDYFTIDGESRPSLRGTGIEDYFGEAWGLRKTDGEYSGCSVFEGGFAGGRATCYRWHVPDPIRFTRSLRVEFQDMGQGTDAKGEDRNNIERADEFSSVAYWYQTGEHAPYPPLPSGYDRLPFDYRRFVDAEKLPVASPDSGKIEVVHVNGLHGDADLEWTGAKDRSELSLPFHVDRTGQFQIMVLIARRPKGAIGRFYIDGKSVSDKITFYSPGDDGLIEIPFEQCLIEAGDHKLTLRCLGSAPEADPGRWFGLDGFIVQPQRTKQK